ncbi:MAG: hypothetical protein JGK17_07225 [Microcoleus sp. PH2017_10_PVI_O_A]|uniref:hypothetical protein n=1 Tax=unclassified Microcoleus TaxID=2642155 RepID=UPI001DFE6229|nr:MULTISPECIES: hypothetical protein [unclassified Microcoleus]TAE84244.1 MAG: hypothetical protein EAZ83_06715 [Oscillatoriales cyanobacterium]MCC3405378.1 hypothetical protein [Microcoleus sp. PH2017_10_PVI_O_A]MCC3459369.1 hypothetical protein [Microcoleus sp. PH2017_11_PCY_U_A]MCC3477650.1 hypothetical protein [Microcoleus sp. PH2017_12_PCY_D_A]MCC3528275.1 hypothetical protein [Microcoleus sp. PH2017_21_RUC_O_A]
MSQSSSSGKEVASAFTRSHTLTSQPRIERAAFSCLGELTHYLRYLAQNRKPGDAIAPQKILAFLLGTSMFYPYKFSGTEPSNFYVMGVQILICLLLYSGRQTSQLHGKFSPPWMRFCCVKFNSRESKHHTVRIGSCKDPYDCSRSHKKWKLFSVFCQEPRKLCQLSLTILTHVLLS